VGAGFSVGQAGDMMKTRTSTMIPSRSMMNADRNARCESATGEEE
jgi:hypothetical protein